MLVLSRKVGEEIIIADNIRVRVVSIQGNQIRLGLTAPREVSIQREELLLRGDHRAPRLPQPDAVVQESAPETSRA
jgi:carbon storage regulator